MKKHTKSNYILYALYFIFSIAVLGCRNKSATNSILYGSSEKLWLFTTLDSFDCRCYYYLIKQNGDAIYFRRENSTGQFVKYFNNLSGDTENNDSSWHLNVNKIELNGVKYKLIKKSVGLDTLELNQFNQNVVIRKYYLINANLY